MKIINTMFLGLALTSGAVYTGCDKGESKEEGGDKKDGDKEGKDGDKGGDKKDTGKKKTAKA